MNSFDLLRLLAATMVVGHHVFPLSGRPSPHWLDTDPGQLGVAVFFVISGYLVSQSLRTSASIRDYLLKRILRVEPALLVCVAATALVMGPLVTDLPVADYFRSPEVYLYVLRNALIYPVTYDLPGVFAHHPLPGIVNASLWTLRLEFTGYLALALLQWRGLFGPRVVAGLTLVSACGVVFLHVIRPDLAVEGPLRIAYIAMLCGFLFLAGALLRLCGARPAPWLIAGSVVLLATKLWPIGLPAVVVALGELRSFRLRADVSYGLYIYAFPLQQILAGAGRLSLWTALAVTLPFALASWLLVERPALRLKPKPVVAE
jgi:peptidoglycan/LPS O-acetylase OafA/YrhL